jgi:hypothetical protein
LSLDKALPSPPPGASGTRSRAASGSYSAFPSQYSTKRTSAISQGNIESKEFAGDPTIRPHPFGGAHKRANLVVEGASQPPSIDGIVDLSNTVDTEVTTRELPGRS